MKKIFFNIIYFLVLIVMLISCRKFEEINNNPVAANADQVQVEYFINNSIIGAQMNPHIAERVFVLYWKTAGHQHAAGGFSSGGTDDGWTSDYYSTDYMGGWLRNINTAIKVAEEKIASGNIKEYTKNLLQVARVWRAYLMSEMSDNFGPIPINAFQGVNPEFSSVKDVYYFLLAELKDASSKFDLSIVAPTTIKKEDPAYAYNWASWQKYANSMRMRLAMRIAEVDASKAKAEFEDAAKLSLIKNSDETFKVKELPGWDPFTGVMSREWNSQILSVALDNIYQGLGGVKSTDQLKDSLHASVKPSGYAGLRLEKHFSLATNNPKAGFWLDGLPYSIDPRAYKAFIIPGDFSNPSFPSFPSYDPNAWQITKRNLMAGTNPDSVEKILNGKFAWNSFNAGDWGSKGSKNQVRGWSGAYPRLAVEFRNSNNSRIFFAPWETYFLLAEAAVKGWTVPMTGKDAYEAGIASSFEYWGVSQYLAAYKGSTEFNLIGTSVSWDHTTEPGASHSMTYKNGYTGADASMSIAYPVNSLYKNGAVCNDHLTKIITQKFIAQTPWLPLEGWSDHRRLGLPFIENPCIENPLPNLPALTTATYMTSNIKFFPQRLKYPSSLKNSNPAGYKQAVSQLGGADEVLTPLWWAKH